MRGIICDHPFLDGNKRTGILSSIVYLSLNNIVFATEQFEIEEFAVRVAAEKLSITEIVNWLEENTSQQVVKKK